MSTELAIAPNVGALSAYLEKGKSAIALALPKHLSPDRMLRLALTAFSTTPALRKCTSVSILSSIVVSSQIGLEPGVGGQAYLIPYGTTCTLVPGWKGLVGLLNNSGRATAWTGAVYEGDGWEFELGSSPKCKHTPGPNFGDADKLIWVYAVGKVNGSESPVVEAWPISRVWKHRDKFNKVGSRHYSFAHPEMYARKVVLLQVLKYMPCSIELSNAMVASDGAEMGRVTQVQDGVVIEMEEIQREIPAGAVGASPLASARLPERPPQDPRKPTVPLRQGLAEEPTQSGKPTPDGVIKNIRRKLAKMEMDEKLFIEMLVQNKIIPVATDLENIDVDSLIAAEESLGE